jgi:hypothetical protein
MNTTLKTTFDWAAVITTIGTFVSWFPEIAGALGIVWWCYRIYETRLSTKILEQQLKRMHDGN